MKMLKDLARSNSTVLSELDILSVQVEGNLFIFCSIDDFTSAGKKVCTYYLCMLSTLHENLVPDCVFSFVFD